jgi:hypothetical protein
MEGVEHIPVNYLCKPATTCEQSIRKPRSGRTSCKECGSLHLWKGKLHGWTRTQAYTSTNRWCVCGATNPPRTKRFLACAVVRQTPKYLDNVTACKLANLKLISICKLPGCRFVLDYESILWPMLIGIFGFANQFWFLLSLWQWCIAGF